MSSVFIVNMPGLFLLKIKEALQLLVLSKNLDEYNRNPNKLRVYKDSVFYHKTMKSWLQNHDRKMYSICNEGKSVVAEIFIRTLKKKIYKHMTLISKHVCMDRLDDTLN